MTRDKASLIARRRSTAAGLVTGSLFSRKLQLALEGKAEGNLSSAVSEMFKFLASCDLTQFSISKSNYLLYASAGKSVIASGNWL
jgi:hypothetical protein